MRKILLVGETDAPLEVQALTVLKGSARQVCSPLVDFEQL